MVDAWTLLGRFTLLPSTDSSDRTTNGCLPRDQVSAVWRRDGNGTLILT
ncbi:MAG: hypothetical protein ING09_13910 [Roseomonas sp.]|nr:hypothetical protein [Roseomonas sp.]MCA3291773.1 hypothetical protein [Roseomonas sp.]MCA3294549.1 hypothetical protein [Roseomonas sp.]MCA4918041.1 hypothetical protein [Roseomonas sp.]